MKIAQKYEILSKLGSGCFGSVYKGVNIRTRELVAIKMEKEKETKLLKNETQIYQYLGNMEGIPHLKWCGIHEDKYYMVMELLGKSMSSCHQQFSLEDVLSIGKIMLKRIYYIHSKTLIHRDIKPDNFVFGLDNETLYLVDFGFAKRYMDEEGNHIPFQTNKSLLGSFSFVSINVNRGMEPSRRDDLESLGYIMIYLNNHCSVGWNTIQEKIMYSMDAPKPIKEYIHLCRCLSFSETPDYLLLYHILDK